MKASGKGGGVWGFKCVCVCVCVCVFFWCECMYQGCQLFASAQAILAEEHPDSTVRPGLAPARSPHDLHATPSSWNKTCSMINRHR